MNLYPSNTPHYNRNKFIDKVYDWAEDNFFNNKFSVVNQWLKDINIKKCDTGFLVSILTITLPAKSKLDYRNEFFNKVKIEIENRNEMEDRLLVGLE